MKLKYTPVILVACLLMTTSVVAQGGRKGPAKSAAQRYSERMEIDSLQQVISMQTAQVDSLHDVIVSEREITAGLREEIIRQDDFRKKLEGNVDSFKGENLKLNQSNRILIVFNSLVAVLLITSLVFFLRKIGRRKSATETVRVPANGKQNDQVKFTNFEDKLAQLERLGKLREKELLSEDEFVVEKQKILGK